MVKAEDQCSWESGFCGCYGTPLYACVCESRSVVSDSLWSHGLYTVYGILYARILEWVAFPFSRGSSQPRDQTQVSHIQVDSLPAEPQGKPKNTGEGSLSILQQIFPTQESNQSLLHCRQILYQLSYQGSPTLRIENSTNCVKFSSSASPKVSPLFSVRCQHPTLEPITSWVK